MGSLFEIAKSGIQAYRQALAVTGQNIANVNTEGYSKRDVALEELGGIQGGVTDVSDQTGLGVRVDEIRRSFNAYVSERLRNAHSSYEQIGQFSQEVALLENILLPQNSDLSTYIGKFFNSLQEVAASPEDSAPRVVAFESGKDLANAFKDYANRLSAAQDGAFTQAKISIDNINIIASQIADVNAKLKSAGATTSANDLLDTRDLLMEELSKEIEYTSDFGERGDVTIKLGNSGQGPNLVAPSKAIKLKGKVTSNSDFRYAFETTVNSISLFLSEGSKDTATTQISGGKLAGSVNYYAYLQEIRGQIDDLAHSIAIDFNEAQKNGKDLTGKIGNDMFLVGLPKVEKNLLADSKLDVKIDQIDSVVNLKEDLKFTYNGNFWRDNNNKIYRGNDFISGSLEVTLAGGDAKSGDSFTIVANKDLAGSLSFNLKSGNEFAASAFKLAESSTSNLGTGELNIVGSYKEDDIGITKVEDIFTNSDTPLLATSFLKDGAIATIGKNIEEIELRSFSLQPLATYVINDDQAKTINSFDLTLANGNSISINFASGDKGNPVLSVRDLADILNSEVSPGGASFSFSSYGLIASGSDGKLTIASNDQNFSSSSISTRSSGTINGIIKNPTASELQASNINIFTREGRHIAGTPLKLEEYSALINKKNGFTQDAVYNAEYINKDYRNIDLSRQSLESDFTLFTGHSASRSSNPVSAQTLSVDTFDDGVIDKTLTIPVSSSSAFALKDFNKNAAQTGISAEAVTRVLIDPIEVTVSGTVSMSLSAGLNVASSVSATVLPDDLTNIVTEINKISEITGVKAILFSDKKRFLLENVDAEDIKITDFVSPSNTTATVLDQNYQGTTSSITLGSTSSNNSAVFTGTIKFQSAVDFSLTSTDGSSILKGDATIKGFDNGRANWTWSDTGETLTLNSISYGSADNSIAANDGSYATKAFSTYSFNLPQINSSSSFTSTVNTENLIPNTDLAIHKAHLESFRTDSPDIRIVGNVINTLPPDGTKLSLEFEGQTYNLETLGKQVNVVGGEEGRIKAFYTPVSGWSGANTDEITSSNTFVVSSGNTFQISVDGISSGTITLPAATYSSNTAVASALETAINSDSTLTSNSKTVSVKWTGTNYEIVSNTGKQTYSISDTTVASVEVTSIDSTIESELKLSIGNRATTSINGYQFGIVGPGSVSASQITFPINSENTSSKTLLGLDGAIKNIEGKAVTNNPTNREFFDVDIKTGSYQSGIVTELSSSSSLSISGTNTLQITVDDVSSGTITMPTGTYTSNTAIANELEEAINDDSTLAAAGKSVSVLWNGSKYQIVSKTATLDASIGITSVSTSLETHLNFTAINGGVATDSSRYRVKYTDAAWLGGSATVVNGSSNLVISSSGNTLQLAVDGTASGTITLPDATYTSNGDIALALQTAINADSNISGASKSVEVKWTGTAYKIISNGTSSQDVTITSVDSAIEANLKLTSSNGGAENDYSFDLYDASGAGAKRQTFLNDINFQWNSTDKNISITRKLDTAPLHKISFISDATNNEKFGIKVHPYNITLKDEKIVISSGNGEPVTVDFTSGLNKSIVGEAISLKNLPPEELIIVLKGGGTARRVSASFGTKEIIEKDLGQNLTFTIDETNDKLVYIIDTDSGHNIAERTLTETGRLKVGGYNLKLSGTAKSNDSFIISDNIGGVGDGRNMHNILKLQNDAFSSEGKGNFQNTFSEIVASVGATVQSSELNLQSAEMIRDASANAQSELSGVNMDDEAAQLIEYQQAYQASARVLQTARDLFDTLIDRI